MVSTFLFLEPGQKSHIPSRGGRHPALSPGAGEALH